MSAQLDSIIRDMDRGTFTPGASAPAAAPITNRKAYSAAEAVRNNTGRISAKLGEIMAAAAAGEEIDTAALLRIADTLTAQADKLRKATA